jgi:DNA primase large subunit
MQLKIEVKKFQDNLKEVVEKYEGEWQRTKHTEVQNQILKNDQLESIKKLEAQLDKSREKLELVQREHLSNIKIQ